MTSADWSVEHYGRSGDEDVMEGVAAQHSEQLTGAIGERTTLKEIG
jgi:hypothetical protein